MSCCGNSKGADVRKCSGFETRRRLAVSGTTLRSVSLETRSKAISTASSIYSTRCPSQCPVVSACGRRQIATCISTISLRSPASEGGGDVREFACIPANLGTPVRSDDSGINQCRIDCAGCRGSFVLHRTQTGRCLGAGKGQVCQHHRSCTQGNFLDSKITLPGWGDCSFY